MADKAKAAAELPAATIVPPIQRATTICQVGTGDIHVKVNEPRRISAPRTASPTTRLVTGSTSPNRAMAATSAKSSVAVPSRPCTSSPKRTAAMLGMSRPTRRLPGRLVRSV
jgi:hypothetical protein